MAGSINSFSGQDSDEVRVGNSDTEYVNESSMEEDGSVTFEELDDLNDKGSDSLSDEDSFMSDNDEDEAVDRNTSDQVCFKTQEWKDISSSESEASSSDDEQNKPTSNSNPAWAKAMQKILSTNKPSGKKSVILSKAEKISKVLAVQKIKETKDNIGFEIDGEVKEEDEKQDIKDIDIKPKLHNLVEKKVKPSLLDRERERRLHKIATKGVVQLFNAVRNQQKEIKQKMNAAGGRVRKEEKVLKSLDKRSFVNMLMGNAENNAHNVLQKIEKKVVKSEEPSDWSVLRDNFMTGGNLKDWDKSDNAKEQLVELS